MEIEQGILLPSYEIPKGEDKNTFSYDSMKNVDYSKLEKSEKFTPALYHEKDGIWEGGSTSRFSPVMIFKLWEKFSDSCLEVSESMEFFYLNRNSLISPGKENFCREVRILNRTS